MSYALVDPDSKVSFEHDWSDYLAVGSPAETIVSRQWTITPLNVGTPVTPTLTGSTTSIVFVEGCQAGMLYRLTERVTTNAGTIDERTIMLRCDHR